MRRSEIFLISKTVHTWEGLKAFFSPRTQTPNRPIPQTDQCLITLNPVASASRTMLWLSANPIASFPRTRNCDTSHKKHTHLCICQVPSKHTHELVIGSPTRGLLLKEALNTRNSWPAGKPCSKEPHTLHSAMGAASLINILYSFKTRNTSFPPLAFSDTEVGPQTNISMWQNPSILVPAAQENKSEQCCQFLTL